MKLIIKQAQEAMPLVFKNCLMGHLSLPVFIFNSEKIVAESRILTPGLFIPGIV